MLHETSAYIHQRRWSSILREIIETVRMEANSVKTTLHFPLTLLLPIHYTGYLARVHAGRGMASPRSSAGHFGPDHRLQSLLFPLPPATVDHMQAFGHQQPVSWYITPACVYICLLYTVMALLTAESGAPDCEARFKSTYNWLKLTGTNAFRT